MEQVPSIGRIVHYIHKDDHHYPAIIRSVSEDPSDGYIDVVIFGCYGDEGTEHEMGIKQDPTARERGTWHWPERV